MSFLVLRFLGSLRQILGAMRVSRKRANPPTVHPISHLFDRIVAGLHSGRPHHGTDGVSPFRPMSVEPAHRPRPLMKPQRADDTLAAEVYSAGTSWHRTYLPKIHSSLCMDFSGPAVEAPSPLWKRPNGAVLLAVGAAKPPGRCFLALCTTSHLPQSLFLVVSSIVETSHHANILMRVLLHPQSLFFPFPPRGSSWRAMGSSTRTCAATIQVGSRHTYLHTNDKGVGYLMPSHHAPPSSAGNTSYQATALRSNSPQTLQHLDLWS
ncbi:hypothetical protein F4678DRAFT_244848 [Xylaria arbuscula]|nr:hypothetical protein F4678DRAFT_244848 [Xylaria arbuscula]